MKTLDFSSLEEIVSILKSGGVGVIPTDTIYGLVAIAKNQQAVEKVYQLKHRAPDKPCIILISDIDQLQLFDIHPTEKQLEFLNQHWPAALSVILDCHNPDLEYLHRGTNSLAFRLPNRSQLQQLISRTGPLVAPSANPEGFPVAKDITEAKEYFADQVNFYLTGEVEDGLPSTLVKLTAEGVEILRQGAVEITS